MSSVFKILSPALVCLLVLGFTVACGSNSPDGYDYHSQPQDMSGLDTWSQPEGMILTDSEGLPDLETEVSSDTSDAFIPPADATLLVPTPQRRTCTRDFEFTAPSETSVKLAGTFTDWQNGELAMEAGTDGTFKYQLEMAGMTPGSYGYKFHTGSDAWLMDPLNPMSFWENGFENSKLVVPDCTVPELVLDSLDKDLGSRTIEVVVSVLDGVDSEGVDTYSARVSVNGEELPWGSYDGEAGKFTVQVSDITEGTKTVLRFNISNQAGPARELFVPVWMDEWQWKDAVMYFAFTDRFANGDPSNDNPVSCTDTESTNWRGGDWKGITQKIEEGYFDELGVNLIWISPPNDNPDGCYDGEVWGKKYTSYHGYFPVSLTEPEEHFGTMAELKALTDAAHARGIRVIADLVGNHVHSDAPLYQEHANDGWFHEYSSCAPNWDQPITCWFQPYMPDLDYTNDQVVELITDSALYWAREGNLDGFRVDAVKHMVHNFARTLRYKLSRELEQSGVTFYMVGETFVGDWGGGQGSEETTIKNYVNDWELNGQFDFPLYWQILRAVGRFESDMIALGNFLSESNGYYGSKAVMSSFIGNHDVPRYISHAAGDIGDLWGNGSKEQGFDFPPALPGASDPYKRAALAFGIIMTLPEVPLIYYGDEIGTPGAGDPDNRRLMQFDTLAPDQQWLKDQVAKLGQARKSSNALRRGNLTVLQSQQDTLVYERTSGSDTVVVALNRADSDQQLSIPAGGLGSESTVTDLLEGAQFSVSGNQIAVTIPARSLLILSK